MEDQSTDSGDLTADAGAASVPSGKSARTRHRLPRQKVRQLDDGENDGENGGENDVADEAAPETVEETPEAVAEVPAPEPEPEPEPEATAPTDDHAAQKESPVAAARTRRRTPWRRGKSVEETPVDAAESDVAESDVADVDPDVAEDAEAESAEPAPILVPHRPAGRALKTIAVAAGVLFIAAGAFAGATLQPYLADRAAVHTKFEIAETAASAITTLWTYTPDDMDKLPERSARFLGGDFATDYRRYIDAIAAPNKQAQVSNNTQVLGAAVESLTPTEATAIVYTNSVATSPVTKGIPSLRYLSYRLTMKRDADRWLITQMVAVTKLDLTPRL